MSACRELDGAFSQGAGGAEKAGELPRGCLEGVTKVGGYLLRHYGP